jgi:gliding motility-associated-like protein
VLNNATTYSKRFYNLAGKTLLTTLFVSIVSLSYAQNCPGNIDFEKGTFTGWTCYTGSNVITLNPSPPMPERHTMLSSFPGDGVDPFGGFPVNCPNGSGHSIKLGNTSGGAEAEGISYEFTIPDGQNQYNLIYNYAVVFQDPNHQQFEQPRMEIEITNETDNSVISCSSFSFFPFGTPLPGFQLSSSPGGPTPVYYKNWSAVSINLNGNAGKRIKLLFKTADCTFRRHFGYAYIDVNSECSGRFEGASFCPEDTVVDVVAPYGYQNYTWYNSTFTKLLGNEQTLSFRPPPPANTEVAVVLVPYNGYGCLDTLYTSVVSNLKVKADAGKDTISCNHSPVQIGSAPQLGVRYKWSPEAGLSNPNIANPLALPDVTTKYTLSARSNGGGCLQTDEVIVKAELVDNNIKLQGKSAFCIGSGDSAVLNVQPADSIQWYRNGVAIPGAIKIKYRVSQSGIYHAVLFGESGCSVNTPEQEVAIASVPVSSFSVNKPDQCLTTNQFIFTNNSTNAVGEMKYRWFLGDGTEIVTKDLKYTYKKAGVYKVKLLVNSIAVCADSTFLDITVYQNPIADFSVQPRCINLPVIPLNKTFDTLSSPISYLWTFGNGQSSTLKIPPAQIYISPGGYDISLSVSTAQCPSPVHTARRTVTIDRPRPGITYPEEFALINLPFNLHARPFGETILWKPAVNLNDPVSYNPVFKGSTEQKYAIDITTKSGCVTTDSLWVKLVKNVEIYMPTAFTPNGDGQNDILRPVLYGAKQLKYFRVFNRWGELMYQTGNIREGWNGIYKNARQEMQTFVWMVEAIGADDKTYSRRGTSILVR